MKPVFLGKNLPEYIKFNYDIKVSLFCMKRETKVLNYLPKTGNALYWL